MQGIRISEGLWYVISQTTHHPPKPPLPPTVGSLFRPTQVQSLGGGFREEIMHVFFTMLSSAESQGLDSAYKAPSPPPSNIATNLYLDPTVLNCVFSPAFLSQNEE